jgi:hypothetical protein
MIWRQLVAASRAPALVVGGCVNAALLSGFVIVWGYTIPLLQLVSAYDQVRFAETVILSVVLPWVAARVITSGRGDSFVVSCALAAIAPSTAIASSVIALSIVLALVAVTGLPALVVAQQVFAIPFSTTVRDLIGFGALAVLAAATTVACTMLVSGRLASWLCAWAATAAFLAPLRANFTSVSWIGTIVGVGIAVCTALWCEGSLWHMADRHD